jgi:hypothetical protein
LSIKEPWRKRSRSVRHVVTVAVGTLVVGLVAGGFVGARAQSSSDPKPIPTIFNFPGPGVDASTITDLSGFVGAAHLTGTATETNTTTNVVTTNLPYEADVRFMQGTYVGVDGQSHTGTFVFI